MVSEIQIRSELKRALAMLDEAHKQAKVANAKVIVLANLLKRKGIIDEAEFNLVKNSIR